MKVKEREVMQRYHRHFLNGNKKEKKSQRYYEDIRSFMEEEEQFLMDYDLEWLCCWQVFVDRSLLFVVVGGAGQHGAD